MTPHITRQTYRRGPRYWASVMDGGRIIWTYGEPFAVRSTARKVAEAAIKGMSA